MNFRNSNYRILLAAAGMLAALPSMAAVELMSYITDNMVVQQNSELTVRGHALPGSTVKAAPGWSKKTFTAKAGSDGMFTLKIATPPAGGPYSLTFSDPDGNITLENILSGEVWLCSGQSNMEMPVIGWGKIMDYETETATAQHPDIRLLQIRKNTSYTPVSDVEVNGGGWQICSPGSVANFSAVAYFYARELARELKVPIGVIDATWGGTPAEAWTCVDSLTNVPGFAETAAMLKSTTDIYKQYNETMQEWNDQLDKMVASFDKSTIHAGNGWRTAEMPGMWETQGLPDFNGVVWMQKSIDVPSELAGQALTLHFSSIDDDDVTYFNNSEAGRTIVVGNQRNYTVPGNLVKAGSNVITVRVLDTGGDGGIGSAEARIGNTVFPLSGSWSFKPDISLDEIAPRPTDPRGPKYPTVLYNAMLEPLHHMPVKGVIWYQGCENVGRAEQYNPLFKAMIRNWRNLWQNDSMPFYFVQLAGFLSPVPVQPESEWAKLREAQAAACELPNTDMITAIDLGNPSDIHPKNKQEVARRLSLLALGHDYGRDMVYNAPKVSEIAPRGNEIIITFNAPVTSTTSAITGFIVAGSDGKYTTATPRQIDERTIAISAPSVKKPVSVRYNWADYPCGNLYGSTGLPVAPFRN